MKIRFGYVSHALSLWECSPAKTMTFTRWKQLGRKEREEKLYAITKENLRNTLRALYYNIAHEIYLYRFSSSMVPLATHPEVDFNYLDLVRDEFADFVKPFFQIIKNIKCAFDVMIESKRKDQALLQLVEKLSKTRGFKRIGGATIELK